MMSTSMNSSRRRAVVWGLLFCGACSTPVSDDARLGVPAGFRAADGSATDAATGLPAVLVHELTGLRLVSIPATASLPAFYISVTEITTGQFRSFVEATGYRTDAERGVDDGNGNGVGSFAALPVGNRTWLTEVQWRNPFPHFPEFRLREDHPVVHVSWNDARAFALQSGMRLPSEVEWEHAARAGRRTLYAWGDTPAGGGEYANVRDRTAAQFEQPELAFPFDDGALLIAPAGSFKANEWGLHDTIGNLAEWVEDSWAKAPAAGAAARVLRGGSWYDDPDGASMVSRAGMHPAARRDFIGFRVALSLAGRARRD